MAKSKTTAAGFNGPMYEIAFLEFFFLRCVENGETFELFSNMKGASKFDDIVLHCVTDSNSQKSCRYFQLKNSTVDKKITVSELVKLEGPKLDFSLPKYFFAYQEIKLNCKNCRIEDVVLFTNLPLGISPEAQDGGLFQRIDQSDSILDYSEHRLSNRPLIFRLMPFLASCLKPLLEEYVETEMTNLANELITSIWNRKTLKLSKDIFKKYHQIMARDVIDTRTKKFRLAFLDGRDLTEDTIKFRNIFMRHPKGELVRSKVLIISEDFGKKQAKKENFPEPPRKKKKCDVYWQPIPDDEQVEWPFSARSDVDIQEFVDTFKLAASQPSAHEMARVMKYMIRKRHPREGRDGINRIYDKMHKQMQAWYLENENGLTRNHKQFKFLEKPKNEYHAYDSKYYIRRTFTVTSFKDLDRSKTVLKNGDLVAWSKEDFDELCGKNGQKSVHLMSDENGQCRWTRSQGSLKGLCEYANGQSQEGDETLNEEDLPKQLADKVKIIVDDAGKGKSVILTRYLELLRSPSDHQDSSKWVELIDFNDNYVIRSLKNDEGENALQRLISLLDLVSEDGDFFQEQIRANNVVILFDGFDEIASEYQKIAIQLLKGLTAVMSPSHLWIATRPHCRHKLEDLFGQFALSLRPFTKQNQIDFLTNFWKTKLKDNHPLIVPDEEMLRKFATDLIDLLDKSTRGRDRPITGIPLQCRMLAEAFFDDLNMNSQGHIEVRQLPAKLNLTGLYKRFWQNKCNVYKYDKCKVDANSSDGTSSMTKQVAKHYFRKLAIRLLFKRDDFDVLWPKEDLYTKKSMNKFKNDFLSKYGMTIDGGSRFVHQTFAEYFAAKWLVAMLTKKQDDDDPLPDTFLKIFLDPVLSGPSSANFKVVRSFINELLESAKNFAQYSCINQPDGLCLVAGVQLAAKEGNANIMRWILHLNRQLLEIPIGRVVGPDKYGRTALYAAASNGHDDVVKLFVDMFHKKQLTIEDLLLADEYGQWIHSKEKRTPLYAASEKGKVGVVRIFVDLFRTKKMTSEQLLRPDKDGQTPLHAASSANVVKKFAELLIDKQIELQDFLSADDKGRTPLHAAAANGRGGVVKEFAQMFINGHITREDIFRVDHDGRTPFYLAAREGTVGTVKEFLQLSFDGYIKIEDFLQPAEHNYTYTSTEKVTKTTRMTPVHAAADNGKDGILNEFVRLFHKGLLKIEDLLPRDHNGETPLHLAAQTSRNVEVVKVYFGLFNSGIIEKSDIFSRSSAGETPLHKAAHRGGVKIVMEYFELYTKKRIDADDLLCLDDRGRTPVHRAASAIPTARVNVLNKYVELFQMSPLKLEDLLRPSLTGATPLYTAAAMGHARVVKIFIDLCNKKQLKVEHLFGPTDKGRTFLHAEASRSPRPAYTALFSAARQGSVLKEIGVLYEQDRVKSEHLLHRDIDGRTALHDAASQGRVEFVKEFLELFIKKEKCLLGALQCRDLQGRTALQSAANAGQIDAAVAFFETVKNEQDLKPVLATYSEPDEHASEASRLGYAAVSAQIEKITRKFEEDAPMDEIVGSVAPY